MIVSSKLTVLFEDPFWIGIFEVVCNHEYEVSRIVFGSEPKDYEVYDFLLGHYNSLRFTRTVTGYADKRKKINPKRLQRKIKKEVTNKGIGTKAQIAMKVQFEEHKVEKKKTSKKMRDLQKERQFGLKQKKKKEKHRGH